jgi:hypothetical protein
MSGSYIGKNPQYGFFEKQRITTANGVLTAFNLAFTTADSTQLLVSVAGVIQEPGQAYTVLAGTPQQISFTEAPATGVDIFIMWLGKELTGPRFNSAMLTDNAAITSLASTDDFLVYDASASALKKVNYQYVHSGVADMAANTVKVRDAATTGAPSAMMADNAIDTAEIADNAVGLAEMAGLARASIIVGDASGDPSALAKGTSEQVLRVNTAGTDLEYADAVGGAAWALKTAAYTAVAGDGVMVDTSSSAITITLPISSGPPSLGDFVRVLDATGNAATNNITVARNGNSIQGAAADLTIATNRAAIGLVYVNVAQGWVLIEN